jgi:class 3 adenylate cyclase
MSKFPSGHFSQLNTVHLHVDGPKDSYLLVDGIVEKLNQEGWDSKVTDIELFVKGPQRKSQGFAITYQGHTPGTDSEQLDYFSTTLLNDYENAKRMFMHLLGELYEQEGIVLELERVIGLVGQESRWSDVPPDKFPCVKSQDVGFAVHPTKPVEIHFSFDVAKQDPVRPPIELPELARVCTEELDILFGGWFLFKKPDSGVWAYRSNTFAEVDFSRQQVEEQRERLDLYLRHRLGHDCGVSVLVEQTLGVWKTPLQPVRLFKDVSELAGWEGNYRDLHDFWVVTPNFLGDKKEEVRFAMIKNLRRGVRYTYFLRSYADFQRLKNFARSLGEEMRDAIDIRDRIKAVLLTSDVSGRLSGIERNVYEDDFFIANPTHQHTEGYRLLTESRHTREICGATQLYKPEIEKIVKLLKPLVDERMKIQGVRVSLRQMPPYGLRRVVMYTDLDGANETRERLGEDDWEEVLKAYDYIVATEVSKHGGEVVKSERDSYLLMFEKSDSALHCAEMLQVARRDYNLGLRANRRHLAIPQMKIAIDIGTVKPVTRAYGPGYIGQILIRCALILEMAESGQVLLTRSFQEDARPSFQNSEFDARVSPLWEEVQFKELGLAVDIYKLEWDKNWRLSDGQQ